MEFTAMLAIEFDVTVDHISRQMFDEKFAAHHWKRTTLAAVWTIDFERSTRESALRSATLTLDLALQGARIARTQVKALVHFGPDAPVSA